MINVLALFPNTIEKRLLDDLSSRTTNALQSAAGLHSLTMSEGNIMSPGGPPAYAKVVEATFVSLEAFMTWVQTPAAQADKDQMMSNGVVMVYYEIREL